MQQTPCKQGHEAGFYGNGQCKECRRISARTYTAVQREAKGPPKPGERGSGVCARGHVNPERTKNRACKECRAELQRAQRADNPVRKFATKYNVGAKRTCKRGHEYVVGQNCMECRRIRAKAARDAHPEKHRDRVRKWQVDNPDKSVQASRKWQAAHPEAMQVIRVARYSAKKNAPGRVSAAEWKAILKKFKGRCAHCGIKLTNVKNSPDQATQDHAIPLQGKDVRGTNYAFNIIPSCRKCNTGKGNRVKHGDQHSLFDSVI